MSLRCPNCRHAIPWPEVIRFTRLRTTRCPGCGETVALDEGTRWYLLLAVSLLLGAMASLSADATRAIGVVFAVGLVAVVAMVLRAGRLVRVPEERDPGGSP